jgi:YqxM protein
MNRIALVAMLAVVLGVMFSLAVVPASAQVPCEWDKSSLYWSCIHSDGVTITAKVCNGGSDMQGTATWELYWAASGNPKDGTMIASGTIPALMAGECYDVSFTFDASHGSGDQYGFKAYQRCGHPGTGVLWITSDEDTGEPCPPIPEIATIGLLSIGLLALGGFVWYRSQRRKEVAA